MLRGWNHNSHQRLYDVADQISEEYGQPDLRLLFTAASTMHQNFYEDLMTGDRVARGVSDVQILMRELDAIRMETPPRYFAETGAQQRRLGRLRQENP